MKQVTKLNLLSLLNLIKSEQFEEIQSFLDENNYVLQTLELLDVITIISSKDPLKITLTPLGSSILANETIISSLSQQDSKLNSISADLQRIKSALSAISLDVIRSQGLMDEKSYGSDFLLKKEETFQEHSPPKRSRTSGDSPSRKIPSYSLEELKEYVHEVYQNMEEEDVQLHQRILSRVKNSYSKIVNLLQQAEFQDFGLESFLLIDSILIFMLQFFGQKDPDILNSSLEKKYAILSNLPLQADLDLIQFLDKINTDFLTNAADPLTFG